MHVKRVAALAAPLLAIPGAVLLFSPIASAAIGTTLDVSYDSASETVGDAARINLVLTVNNTDANDGQTSTIDQITVFPSCGAANDLTGCPAPSVDPGVFSATSATGTAGVCNGRTFSVSAADAGTGALTLTPLNPPTPLVIADGGTCTISIDGTVVDAPDVDAGDPGVQTVPIASVRSTTVAGSAQAFDTGPALTVVGDAPNNPNNPNNPVPGTCNGLIATIDHGSGDQTDVVGTPGNDVVLLGSGNDVYVSNGGNDTVCAGSGDDKITLSGAGGWVDAGSGNDTITGGAGNDAVLGGSGDDSFTSGGGTDTVDLQSGESA